MATERILQIPSEQLPALKRLVAMPASQREAFVKALAEAGPHLRIADLASRVLKKSGLDAEVVEDALLVAVSLYATREAAGLTVEEFIEDTINALNASGDAELEIKADEQVASFIVFLKAVLSQDRALGLTAKARRVAQEHEHLYCHSRIYSDIRPIFDVGTNQKLGAAVIVHNLKLHYHLDDSDDTIFIAIDRQDLVKLKKEVDRALEKDATLRAFLEKASIPVLDHDQGGE